MTVDMHIVVVDESKVSAVQQYLVPPSFASETPETYTDLRVAAFGDAFGWGDNPSQWIGEFSSNTVPINGKPIRWVPRSVERINHIYNYGAAVKRITPGLIAEVTTAFNLPHDSWFEIVHYDDETGEKFKFLGVARARNVKKFLTKHMGKFSYVDFE